MKREELARLARNQSRIAFVVLFVVLAGFVISVTGFLGIPPEQLPRFAIPALAALVVIIIVGLWLAGLARVPRCPHCKGLLTGYLLRIAIASGNCAYCGKSVED
jgi:hypothetical protein